MVLRRKLAPAGSLAVYAVLPAAEIIAVDDGSRDETRANIQAVPGVLGMRLDRNPGQSAAIYDGLQAATGELCGVMEADGQDDPTRPRSTASRLWP